MDVGWFLLQHCTLFHSYHPCSGLISYSVTNSRTSFCAVTSLEDFSLLRSTRMHSSRMRTARSLAVSHCIRKKLKKPRMPPRIKPCIPPVQPRTPPPEQPRMPPPPVVRIVDTRFWKYYLAPTSLRAVKMSVLCCNNAVYTWPCLQRIRLLRTLGCKEQFVFFLTSMLKCSVKTSTADFCELNYSLLAGPGVFTFLFNGHLLLTATIFERKVA